MQYAYFDVDEGNRGVANVSLTSGDMEVMENSVVQGQDRLGLVVAWLCYCHKSLNVMNSSMVGRHQRVVYGYESEEGVRLSM